MHQLAKEMLSSFEPVSILTLRLYVGDTDDYKIGDIIEKSERLTIIEKIKRIFGFYPVQAYKVKEKLSGCLCLVPCTSKPEKIVREWSVLPNIAGGTVTFKRPIPFKFRAYPNA